MGHHGAGAELIVLRREEPEMGIVGAKGNIHIVCIIFPALCRSIRGGAGAELIIVRRESPETGIVGA